jgi:hypothetical protein
VGCRSDPAVILSNGTVLDLSAAIADADMDVQNVTYTLHAPAGTSVVAAINTYGPLGPKETFRFFADDAPGTYDTFTSVTTGANGIAVSATTAVVPILHLPASGSAAGQNQQSLPIHISL